MQLTDLQIKEQEKTGERLHCEKFTVEKAEKRPSAVRAGSMMAKIGLCAFALACAILLRVLGLGSEEETRETSAEAATLQAQASETGEEDGLGSLHFVDAGTDAVLLGVGKWSAPLRCTDVQLIREDTLLCYTAAEEQVSACCAGEVNELAEDPLLGSYVRLRCANDTDVILYGFRSVSVQLGQQVSAGDALGSVAKGDSVYFAVLQGGALQDPLSYVELGVGG